MMTTSHPHIDRLLAFANLGHDDGKPRPLGMGFLQSRALGLDATHREYALDEGAPQKYRLEDHTFFGEVRTQTHGGIVRRWIRPAGDADWTPAPPLEAPVTPEAWAGYLDAYPPPGHQPGAKSKWVFHEATAPEALWWHLERIRDAIRTWLLEPTWLLMQAEQGSLEADAAERDLYVKSLRLALAFTARYSLWPDANVAPQRLQGAANVVTLPPLEQVTFPLVVKVVETAFWRYRGRVLWQAEPTPHYVADAWPGHAWALVLTAFGSDRRWPDFPLDPTEFAKRWSDVTPGPEWRALRGCHWCGRYFRYIHRPKTGGRRDFCSDGCAVKFSNSGRAELRKNPPPAK